MPSLSALLDEIGGVVFESRFSFVAGLSAFALDIRFWPSLAGLCFVVGPTSPSTSRNR